MNRVASKIAPVNVRVNAVRPGARVVLADVLVEEGRALAETLGPMASFLPRCSCEATKPAT